MDDILREFLIETHENLAKLDLDFVALEKDPGEREIISRVFRTIHTVKGTAGFLDLPKLERVAHASENLLSKLRSGDLQFNEPIATALLGSVDAIRRMLAELERSQQEGDEDDASLIASLERLSQGSGDAGRRLPPPTPAPVVQQAEPPPPPPSVSVVASKSIVEERPESTAAVIEPRGGAVADASIRVDVNLLDKLMTLVGELVLARNRIVQLAASQEDAALHGTIQRLNVLTTELQAGLMKTRMQPISCIWTKFPRVVRDLSAACGKQVRLEMEGQETELDKTVVEAIRDPLTHMVRNAVDHGIEPPSVRLAHGKPAEGRLHLHASHEGGNVTIRIADDGGGIDPVRVRSKAVQNNLLSAERAARMSDAEAMNLLFLPGFSTADQVTQFSGRGVGMDVVRTNIEKIGGAVALESAVGVGTTLTMRIPLTLAIIPALTVACGGERFAIPQSSLLELVRLEGERSERGIERFHDAPVYRLRGRLLPLVDLGQLLGLEARGPEGDVVIVVMQVDERQFGLIVDAVFDTEEIVVKPLQKLLKGIAVFAGATIMGDGRVALILDVQGLARTAHVATRARDRSAAAEMEAAAPTGSGPQTLLVFASATGGRMALPLSLVARLEEFPRSMCEPVGGRRVIQYRGEILPLVSVQRALDRMNDTAPTKRSRTPSGRRDASSDRPLPVVVYSAGGRQVGLVVGRIVDIVEATMENQAPGRRRGVMFSAVVQGRVTEFLDVEDLFSAEGIDAAAGATS